MRAHSAAASARADAASRGRTAPEEDHRLEVIVRAGDGFVARGRRVGRFYVERPRRPLHGIGGQPDARDGDDVGIGRRRAGVDLDAGAPRLFGQQPRRVADDARGAAADRAHRVAQRDDAGREDLLGLGIDEVEIDVAVAGVDRPRR